MSSPPSLPPSPSHSSQAIQVELQKALKKKERVEKEEREMYQRMVKGVSPTEGETGAKIKKTKSRVDKWVSTWV